MKLYKSYAYNKTINIDTVGKNSPFLAMIKGRFLLFLVTSTTLLLYAGLLVLGLESFSVFN